jgi:hypothetical protein
VGLDLGPAPEVVPFAFLPSENPERAPAREPKIYLDLSPVSVYINLFQGHPEAPGPFLWDLRLGSQIQKSSILDVPWRIY